MKFIACIILLCWVMPDIQGQPSLDSIQEEETSTFSLQLNQDNTFGFFPAIFGSIPLKDFSLTFYSIFWTTHGFANPDGSGSLIETGLGVGLTRGAWYLNPSVGFTHGVFTNIRDANGVSNGRFAESIVPGVTAFLESRRWEAELFAAFYQNLRRETASQTNYLFLWALPGLKMGRHFSAGLHYEQFRPWGEDMALYSRYGLYAKATVKNKYELRLSGGLNYTPAGDKKRQGDFYKLTANIPF